MAADPIYHDLIRDGSLRIELNIGGQIFLTTKDTLSRDPQCYFASLLRGSYSKEVSVLSDNNSDEAPNEHVTCFKREDKLEFFVDRDPTHFRYVLNYLRMNRVHLPHDLVFLGEVHEEAVFYQMRGLITQIEALQHRLLTKSREMPTSEKEYKLLRTRTDRFENTFKKWVSVEGYELMTTIPIPNEDAILLVLARPLSAADMMLFDRLRQT